MATSSMMEDRPNGPVAAALIAGGVGSAVLGLATTLAEASSVIKDLLNWYNPVGPLIGKTGVAVIAFAVSWIVLHGLYRGKEVNLQRAATLAFVLLAVGLIGTFPPFFTLFAAE